MTVPDRQVIEYACEQALPDWKWHAILAILGFPERDRQLGRGGGNDQSQGTTPPSGAALLAGSGDQAPAPHGRDTIERTCVVCGRVGTRRFVPAGEYGDGSWRCSPTATACAQVQSGQIPKPGAGGHGSAAFYRKGCRCDLCKAYKAQANGRRYRTGQPASEPGPKPDTPQVNTLAEPPSDIRGAISTPNVTPAAPPTPGVTARCQDCTRTWNITGRILDQAIEMHELKHAHIVTTHEHARAQEVTA